MSREITVEVTDVVGEWTKFLKKQYRRELAELSREYPHNRSLVIDYRTILNNRLAFELSTESREGHRGSAGCDHPE
ncbi:MAG: hypothetical protein RQM90_13975 [Methanoculleus sp.]